MMETNKPGIGLQLWTIRKELEENLDQALQQIAGIGYTTVETAFWPEGITVERAAHALRNAGLQVIASHCHIEKQQDREDMLRKAEAYSCRKMVWHGWPQDSRTTSPEGTKALAELYNQTFYYASTHGLEFGIHNHWWEFEEVQEGKTHLQLLLEHLEEDIFLELDTYWASVAGQDPALLLQHLGNRCPLLHIKDGPVRIDEPMLAVGQGVQDFDGIASASQAECWIVELDQCATDMMTAVRQSYQYLRHQRYVS